MRRTWGWLLAAMVISGCGTVEPRPEMIDACELLSREALAELARGLPRKAPPTVTTTNYGTSVERSECLLAYGDRTSGIRPYDELAPELPGEPAFRQVTISLQRLGDTADGTGTERARHWLKSYETSTPVGEIGADGAFVDAARLAAFTGNMVLMVEVDADNVNGTRVAPPTEETVSVLKHLARDAIHTLRCYERVC